MKNWPKIALQFYIYDMLVQKMPQMKDKRLFNCIYSTAGIFKEKPSEHPLNIKFHGAVSERLKGMLEQMYDVDVPFRRTDDEQTCAFCDFRNICGR